MYADVCAGVCVCRCVCRGVCVQVCLYMKVCMQGCVCMHMSCVSLCMHVCMQVCMQVSICVYAYVYLCTHVCIYVPACISVPPCPCNCSYTRTAHTHTHTQSRAAQSSAAPCSSGTRERCRSRGSFPAPLRQSRRVPLTLLQTAAAFGTRDGSRRPWEPMCSHAGPGDATGDPPRQGPVRQGRSGEFQHRAGRARSPAERELREAWGWGNADERECGDPQEHPAPPGPSSGPLSR